MSQIRLQYEAGFEDGLEQTGLSGSALDVEDTDAVDAALDAGVDLVIDPAVEFDIGRRRPTTVTFTSSP